LLNRKFAYIIRRRGEDQSGNKGINVEEDRTGTQSASVRVKATVKLILYR
jgi:hypothetical protein